MATVTLEEQCVHNRIEFLGGKSDFEILDCLQEACIPNAVSSPIVYRWIAGFRSRNFDNSDRQLFFF